MKRKQQLYAFVTMETPESAQLAITDNEKGKRNNKQNDDDDDDDGNSKNKEQVQKVGETTATTACTNQPGGDLGFDPAPLVQAPKPEGARAPSFETHGIGTQSNHCCPS